MSSHEKQYVNTKTVLWAGLVTLSLVAGLLVPHLNPLYLLVGILLVLNVFLIALYPTYGLLAYLFIFLYRPGELYPILAPLRIEMLLGVLVILVIVIHQKIRTGGFYVPRDPITLSLIALLVIMFMSTFTSYEKTETIFICKEFTKILAFYYMIVSVIDTRKRFVAFILVYVAMMVKIASDGLMLYLTGGYIHTMNVDRLQGTTSAGGDPNALAATMAISIPILGAACICSRYRIVKVTLILLSLFMIYVIAITGSRAGLLALLGIMLGGIMFSRRKILISVTAIVLLIGGWTILPEQYQERYETILNTENVDDTSSGRLEVWIAGLKMFAAYPIIGVGAGAFRWATGSGDFGYQRYMQAHNIFIQLLATMGILGLAVWIMFMRSFVSRLRALIHATNQHLENDWIGVFSKAISISLIALLIGGLFGHNLYRYNWYMLAGLTTAMYAIAKKPIAARLKMYDQDNAPKMV